MTKPGPRIPRFDLVDLRLYIAVAGAGSLTQGAARLPLAVSAASARLKGLEDRLGLPLFHRTATGVVPTEAGNLFLDYARRVTHTAQVAQQMMDALQDDGRVSLTVVSNHMGLSADLPARLGRFLNNNPAVDIRLEQAPSREVFRSVEAGEADLGIVDQSLASDSLLMMPYRRDKLVVLVASGHPLATQATCSFAEALAYPLIGMVASSSLQVFVDQMALLGHLPARYQIRVPTFASAAQLVAENTGVAFMPEPPARRFEQFLPVVMRELTDSWAIRDLLICIRPDVVSSAPASRLAVFLSRQEPVRQDGA